MFTTSWLSVGWEVSSAARFFRIDSKYKTKIPRPLLLLAGATVLVHGLNIGRRDENSLLVGRQTASAPCVEIEGPDNCPDDGPDRYNDGPPPPGPKGDRPQGPKGDGPPPPERDGDRSPPPREGERPPAPAAAHGACVEIEGSDDCPDPEDEWDDRQNDGDRDQDGVPNWQDTTDDRPRRADGSPLPPQCWPNPPPQREGDPPRPVCTEEDRNGPGRDRDWDDDDNRDWDWDGPGRGGRDGDRDYDGVPNWQDTTDDRPRRADGSPLPLHCWDNPPPLREGEPPRPVCTDEDRNGLAGTAGVVGTGSVPANTNGNTNANPDINPSGDVVGTTDSYRQDSSVRQVGRNAGGRNSVPVLGAVAGLTIAFAAFL
ncbi:hypothetical protein AC579_7416 [Pseudocercospora musae]|uniref:Uncharacterized protein n=1 Tax=Pseudocercospora musae TaxID=113226 RepID=A0A139IQJ9_9PEZI|nr:hypothetical protein AC579_7416 [Pseudocercospora musae]